MILIKLGGSVITDKNRKYTFKKVVTQRLIKEIRSPNDEKMIIVHGGGSFGHPNAEKYRINTENPLHIDKATAQIQRDMRRLNGRIIQLLIEEGLWAVSLPGGLITTYNNGDLEDLDIELFNDYLSIGTIPVSFGDVAIDKKRGVTICSGDDIMEALASLSDKAVFVTDVDGIYKEGTLIEKFTEDMLPLDNGDMPLKKNHIDVTGGMNRKVKLMLKMAKRCRTYVVNGMKKGRLGKIIRGEDTVCTEVVKDD